MLTVTCETPGTLRADHRLKPTRGQGEVLVRIKRVGVCGTDLHIFSGNQPYLSYPRVMGHELSGVVEEAPAGSSLAPGDRSTSCPTSPAVTATPAARARPTAAATSRCWASTATAA